MASVLVPKVRLVRCPKCCTLLQEPTGVPVYKCAGCETLLQAKGRKTTDDNARFMSQKTDPVKINESEPSSEYHKGSSSSSNEKLLFSSGDCSLHSEKGKNQIDVISDQLVAAKISSGEQKGDNPVYRSSLSSIEESGVSKDADSSPELPKNGNYGFSADETEAKSEGSKLDASDEHGSGFKPIEARQSSSFITTNKKKAKTFSSDPSLGKHYGKRYDKWNRSQMGFYARGPSFSSGYEIGSSSDQTYHVRDNSRFLSHQMPDAARWKQKLLPPYSNFELPNQVCHDMGNGRYDKDIEKLGWESRRTIMSGRNCMSHSCLCSDQYPPPVPRQFHPSHDHRNSHRSFSGSPRRLLKSENYPRWSCEMASDVKDHRHSGYEVNKYPRGKYVSKRHIRPTAGAAPFVTCHNCSAILHLPVDFLIFKRKHHSLKCGVCLKILRFSLQDTTRLVPAVLNPVPSLDTVRNGNGDPASCSEDYAEDINEFELDRLFSEVPKPEETTEYEIMEPLQTKGSPLHRLMGYSSVSQVFRELGRPPSRTSTEDVPGSRISTTWIKNRI